MMVIALLLLAVVSCFGVGAWLGAPYLPVLGHDTEALLDLADVKGGQTVVDLGAGDGKLLRAAARRGARGIGYEINPLIYVLSKLLCLRYRHQITLHWRNYWLVPLPDCDVVYVFLIDRYMERLDTKLTREARRRLKLVSYVFKIPGRTPISTSHNAQVYEYGGSFETRRH